MVVPRAGDRSTLQGGLLSFSPSPDGAPGQRRPEPGSLWRDQRGRSLLEDPGRSPEVWAARCPSLALPMRLSRRSRKRRAGSDTSTASPELRLHTRCPLSLPGKLPARRPEAPWSPCCRTRPVTLLVRCRALGPQPSDRPRHCARFPGAMILGHRIACLRIRAFSILCDSTSLPLTELKVRKRRTSESRHSHPPNELDPTEQESASSLL